MSAAAILHVLQHALGTDRFGRGTMYRSHFVTDKGSIDHPVCMQAVELGLMDRHAGNTLTGEMDLFVATAAGKAYVVSRSPKPDRRQRNRDRYSRWLNISDIQPDLTFGEFLRREKEFSR